MSFIKRTLKSKRFKQLLVLYIVTNVVSQCHNKRIERKHIKTRNEIMNHLRNDDNVIVLNNGTKDYTHRNQLLMNSLFKNKN